MKMTKKSKETYAYEPSHHYICIYETKEDGIGYATFDTESALRELLEECKSQGDKILKACRIDFQTDILEFSDHGYTMKYLTSDIVNELNAELENKKYPFRFNYLPCSHEMEIILVGNTDAIVGFELCFRDEFKDWLDQWLGNKGLRWIYSRRNVIHTKPIKE